jgi:predicted TIM-barrel fold metal-dependent hydrolase
MEIIHPAHIHSKTLIAEMKEAASEGIKLMLSGLGTTAFPLHETGPVYAVRMIKEVGADHFVYGSDFGQIHNPSHLIGTEWTIKLLFAYGATKEELKKVFQTNPAKHLGLEEK